MYEKDQCNQGTDAAKGGYADSPMGAQALHGVTTSPNLGSSDLNRRVERYVSRSYSHAQQMASKASLASDLNSLMDSLPRQLSPEAQRGLEYLLNLAGI